MKYEHIESGIFLARPNRFIAHVRMGDQVEVCHVKNTGRCRELLQEGCTVYLERSGNPKRKTRYDLVSVESGGQIINMDSQAPNSLAEEWVLESGRFQDLRKVKREQKYGDSRFDLYVEAGERRILMEVKGVTLKEGDTAYFPDAPTLRGVKHIRELIRCQENGFEPWLFFVIQMKGIKALRPNDRTQAEFGEALREAKNAGVRLLASDCLVEKDSIRIDQEIPILL